MRYIIECSEKRLVNTDPQRRCYNGTHAHSELIDTSWGRLDTADSLEAADKRVLFWKSMSDYAVSQRGESACRRFRVIPVED